MTIQELAAANRAAVRAFLDADWGGADAPTDLLVPGGLFEEAVLRDGRRVPAQRPLAEWAREARTGGRRLRFVDATLFEGDDPDRILVKTWRTDGAAEEPLILDFLLDAGRVARLRAIRNPCEALHR